MLLAKLSGSFLQFTVELKMPESVVDSLIGEQVNVKRAGKGKVLPRREQEAQGHGMSPKRGARRHFLGSHSLTAWVGTCEEGIPHRQPLYRLGHGWAIPVPPT